MKFLLCTALIAVNLLQIDCGLDGRIAKAVFQSCPGCSLNRLTEIKKFAYEDIPKYDETVEFRKVQGAPPVLIFYNQADEEIERFALNDFTRQECNNLLRNKGFNKKIAAGNSKEL